SSLETALSHIPDNIPLGNQRYNFEHFSDPEKIELYGTSEAAVNQELEVTFAPKGRRDDSAPCPFEFEERGPGLVAVVKVLRDVLHEYPNSAILQKQGHSVETIHDAMVDLRRIYPHAGSREMISL
ncbi:hypothetical protein P692DRAFT_20721415, partial [Suillus brevipes Sb2]